MNNLKLYIISICAWVLKLGNSIINELIRFTKSFWVNKFRNTAKWIWYIMRIVIAIVVFLFILIQGIPVLTEFIIIPRNAIVLKDTALRVKQEKIEKVLSKDIAQLEKKMAAFTPKYPYIIINTTDNTFYVYRGQILLRKGKCSTGSYINLVSDNKKSWVFKTPRGERRIHGKITSPVWRKPDWAFIEEGIPIPSAFHNSRYEYGVLGDYALSIGDGYLIHGTIYKRQLGMPVTHGCVRLNDEDLKYVYQTLEVGSRVFIY